MNEQPQVLFREQQRFKQPWLWLLVGGSMLFLAGVFAWGLYSQLILGEPFGDRPISDTALIWTSIFVFAISFGVIALMLACKLITEVRDDGVFVRYLPFHLRYHLISMHDATRWEAVTYRPIMEYGGWGIRWTMRGRAYNVYGNRGVRIDFGNGRHLLIGSQRPDELEAAINQLLGGDDGP